MKIGSLRLVGIRCFEDTGLIGLSPRCNVFVGENNTGKSTLLRAVLSLQGQGFHDPEDVRSGGLASYVQVMLESVPPHTEMNLRHRPSGANFDVVRQYRGDAPASSSHVRFVIPDDSGLFNPSRPNHGVVPFLARRKTQAFDQNIAIGTQNNVMGNLTNLYSRIDLIATAGHPRHEQFLAAVDEIIGIRITTKASQNGKEAGFYIGEDKFVTLDRMGDGITEMVALIVELCLEHNRIFVLEEPETNLHPRALKALLAMVRNSSDNQFIIATHSNIVVREIGLEPATKIFHVRRESSDPRDPSRVDQMTNDANARVELLQELGYEFADMALHDAWLILEEASAESILNDVLVPMFCPGLAGRLRTFAAGGIAKVEPRVSDFLHLVTFIHLEPAYAERLWVRVDGDEEGRQTCAAICEKFPYLAGGNCDVFGEPAFEHYYPRRFNEKVREILSIKDKPTRRTAKFDLLTEVLTWTAASFDEAKKEWAVSAKEPIHLLENIYKKLS